MMSISLGVSFFRLPCILFKSTCSSIYMNQKIILWHGISAPKSVGAYVNSWPTLPHIFFFRYATCIVFFSSLWRPILAIFFCPKTPSTPLNLTHQNWECLQQPIIPVKLKITALLSYKIFNPAVVSMEKTTSNGLTLSKLSKREGQIESSYCDRCPKIHRQYLWCLEWSICSMSRLWNSMMPEVSNACMFMKTAKDVWDSCKQKYSKVGDYQTTRPIR